MSQPAFSRKLLDRAISDLARNPEQARAVAERNNCIVLAGPGSGKTKTLTTAMARVLSEEIEEPQGVACITYSNECAHELESRLSSLGITTSEHIFIGTVHSFALAHVISPYARCAMPELPNPIRVATRDECRAAVEDAYAQVVGGAGDPHARWRFAEVKRREQVNRDLPAWRERNPELADFIEAYETILRGQGLIDFDDMPLLAYRLVRDNVWIRNALRARFPVIFVDEYQDLGHALHELILLLCFEAGIRLFAVGDIDQSIYGFTGANPELLESLTQRQDVTTVRLRLNYRCGTDIISASMAALGEERDYAGPDGATQGIVRFDQTDGNLDLQADAIAAQIIPGLHAAGTPYEEIAVLYRAAYLGDMIASSLQTANIPFVRADTNALVPRSSKLARFVEACAAWTTGGWQEGEPTYRWLLDRACNLVFDRLPKEEDRTKISDQLITFLSSSLGTTETTHAWFVRLKNELTNPWQQIGFNPSTDWGDLDRMIERTNPVEDLDMPLIQFSGRQAESGRVNLSTLHSSKGREFDAVILYGMNADLIPNNRDRSTTRSLQEARRLFYVGVTRPRKELRLVFQRGNHSPWVAGLYRRLNPPTN